METMEIIITQEDAKDSDFLSNTDCALARAVKRIGITQDPHVGTFFISENEKVMNNLMYPSEYCALGKIHPEFKRSHHDKLLSGEIKEFKTIYTPIK